jgi:endo-alpha-1,4-polygalactosaminidase (GH114 family)
MEHGNRTTRALAVAFAAVLMAGAADRAAASPRDPRLAAVRSFAFAIGAGDLSGDVAARYAPFDLVVVDGEGASAAQLDALHTGGKLVLGYLDVGGIERNRWWFAQAKPYRLDYWSDWGEWYAKVAASGYRRLLLDRVAPSMLRKGFDGLFLDNTDMIANHSAQTAGMVALVRSLAVLVHHRHGFLFTQNGEDVIGGLLSSLDGWNREDVTWTYDFGSQRYVHQPPADVAAAQAALRRLGAAGLLVTATDYVATTDRGAAREAIANACAAGALPFVSDIGLTRIARTDVGC